LKLFQHSLLKMPPIKMEKNHLNGISSCPVKGIVEWNTLIQTVSSRFHLTVPFTAETCFRKPLPKLSVYVASKIEAGMFHCIVLKCKSQLLGCTCICKITTRLCLQFMQPMAIQQSSKTWYLCTLLYCEYEQCLCPS